MPNVDKEQPTEQVSNKTSSAELSSSSSSSELHSTSDDDLAACKAASPLPGKNQAFFERFSGKDWAFQAKQLPAAKTG